MRYLKTYFFVNTDLIKNFIRGRNAKSYALVLTSVLSGQAISFLCAPILTRMYGADNYGALGVFNALVSVLGPIGALTYPMAIVLPKRDLTAVNLVRFSMCLSAFIALGLFLVLNIINQIVPGLNYDPTHGYSLCLPLMMFISVVRDVTMQSLIRVNRFELYARIEIGQAIINNGLKLLIGLKFPTKEAFVVSTVLGGIFGAIFNLVILNQLLKIGAKNSIVQSVKFFKKLALKYRDFSFYRAPQNLINGVSQSLPVLIFAEVFDDSVAGYYSLAVTVLGIPTALVGKSVSEVFYRSINADYNSGLEIRNVLIKSTKILILIGCLPYLAVFISGPWLFAKVFGADWFKAGEFARWLTIFYFFNFINRPCVTAMPVLGIQSGLMFYEVLSSGAKMLSIYVGFCIRNDPVDTIIIYSIVGAVAYVALIWWILINSAKPRTIVESNER